MKKLLLTFFLIAIYCCTLQAQTVGTGTAHYYDEACELMENNGKPEEIINLLQLQISDIPEHIPSYLMLSIFQSHDGDNASALKSLNMALQMNSRKSGVPNEIILWYKGEVYAIIGDYEKAIGLYEQALKKADKKCPDEKIKIIEDLAYACHAIGDYSRSDECYQFMKDEDESRQLPYIGLVRNCIARKEYTKALDILDRCALLNEDYSELFRYRLWIYDVIGNTREAIDNMISLYCHTKDYNDFDPQILLGEYDYAIARLKEQAEKEASDPVWNILLINMYERGNFHIDALAICNQMFEEYGSDPGILLQRAEILNKLGLFEYAISDLNQVIESGTADEAEYAERGYSYENLGMFDKALSDYSMVIELEPTISYGYYRCGLCYEFLKDDKRAIEYYNKGISIDPSYPYIYLMRGEQYLKADRLSEAYQDFQMILQLDTCANEYSCRQYALLFLGDEQGAYEWMDKVIESSPNDAGVYYDKACLLSRGGRIEEAIGALETAFEMGFRRFKLVELDDDLDVLRASERFQELFSKYMKQHEELMVKLKACPTTLKGRDASDCLNFNRKDSESVEKYNYEI